MLHIICKNKEEIIANGKGLYRLFCVAAVATEIIAISIVALIIVGATFM